MASKHHKTGKKKKEKKETTLRQLIDGDGEKVGLTTKERRELPEKESLAWQHPMMPDVEATKAALEMETTSAELQSLVEKHMGLPDCRTDLRSVTVRDYYVTTLWYIKTQDMILEEASATLQLSTLLLENLRDKRMGLMDNQKFFMQMMKEHASEEDQLVQTHKAKMFKRRLKDFQSPSIKPLAEFFGTGLFQHYRMYMYLFFGERPQQQVNLPLDITLPTPGSVLDEGRSKTERLQLEADATLAAVAMPKVPHALPMEMAEAIRAEAIETVLMETGEIKALEVTDEIRENVKQLSKEIAETMTLTAAEKEKKK